MRWTWIIVVATAMAEPARAFPRLPDSLVTRPGMAGALAPLSATGCPSSARRAEERGDFL